MIQFFRLIDEEIIHMPETHAIIQYLVIIPKQRLGEITELGEGRMDLRVLYSSHALSGHHPRYGHGPGDDIAGQ